MEVADTGTNRALAYVLPRRDSKRPPLLAVLHGAAKNENGVWDLANPRGEHAGLAPSLLATGTAPQGLSENLAVVAPFAEQSGTPDRQSFYEEPRSRVLQVVEWACSGGVPGASVDRDRIFLFGFSDGATVGVELMTTRRFAGAVVAAYGFTGELPPRAKERLRGLPMWVFHAADDVIFPVGCSDRLVASLQDIGGGRAGVEGGAVRYTRYTHDQEGFTGPVRGHSTGITASRTPEIYT